MIFLVVVHLYLTSAKMRTQLFILAALAAFIQVEGALMNGQSGGFFGGLFGKKQAEFNHADTLADEESAISKVQEKIESGKSIKDMIVDRAQNDIEIVKETAQKIGDKIVGKAQSDIELVESALPENSFFGRFWGFLTGWMKPHADVAAEAAEVAEAVESPAATLATQEDGSLPVLSQAGVLKPPTGPAK